MKDYHNLTIEQQLKVDEEENYYFDDWADNTCKYNGFYSCSNKNNSEKECFMWNCPKVEEFYNSQYYQDCINEVLNNEVQQ